MIILERVQVLGEDGLSRPRDVEITARGGPEVIDASGCILSPGWIDLHAHLREPGFSQKETLRSGMRSAAAGGFTHVVAMANTKPVTDNASLVRTQIDRTAGRGIRVSFAGALTYGLNGAELTDALALKQAGVVALSDDGQPVVSTKTLEFGLSRAGVADLPVFVHAAYGSSPDAEVDAVGDSIEAVRNTPGGRLHVQHVSTREAVRLIGDAKAQGLNVTAEATPHHLSLTADEVAYLGPEAAVNPPLRSPSDRAALMQGLLDGTIDAIATDHAPHEPGAKAQGAVGFHGFETALSVVLTLGLPCEVVYRACVKRPAEILQAQVTDDWTLFDPRRSWVVDPDAFHSLGHNSPFAGSELPGVVRMTIARGEVVYRN